jgi:hypothetical protein
LKSSRDDTGDGQIFVKLFPSQCMSIHFNLNLLELIFRRLTKNAKTVSRKTEYPAVCQFKVDEPLFGPSSDCHGFGLRDYRIHGICPSIFVRFQTQAARFPVNHEEVNRDCELKLQVPAKTCMLHRRRAHGCVEADHPHLVEMEIAIYDYENGWHISKNLMILPLPVPSYWDMICHQGCTLWQIGFSARRLPHPLIARNIDKNSASSYTFRILRPCLMTELPKSHGLHIAALSGLFRHTTNSYKFIFFLSLLDLLKRRKFEVLEPFSFSELTIEMLAIAWFPHTFFKLSFGTQDTLAKKLDSLTIDVDSSSSRFFAEDKRALRSMLERTDLTGAMRLMDFVPYRLLIPFLEQKLRGIDKGAWMVLENAMPRVANENFNELRPLYRFDKSEYKDCRSLFINSEWASYLQSHFSIVYGWASWNWLQYMQKRNPTTPGISNKLFMPSKRDSLAKQTRYWRQILESPAGLDFNCIYSGAILLPDQFTLDHYLPWSFVVHDQLSNLIPAPRSVNSSKSNNIPSTSYFRSFVELQHKGLVAARNLFPKSKLDKVVDSYISDLHIRSPEDLFVFDRLFDAYGQSLSPLVTLAINQGFTGDWRFVQST